jgi:hypothetical protein
MDLKYHEQLTVTAAPSSLSSTTIAVIVSANLAVDLNQFDSALHFDNCAFAPGLEHIDAKWTAIAHGQDTYTSFGQLLHTVQDFYAHSNWIELHQQEDPVPIWDLTLASLPPDIVSGTYSVGSPKLCGPDAPDHAQINKDSPNSEEGRKIVQSGPNQGKSLFDLAYDTALRATQAQFAQLLRILPAYTDTAYIKVTNNFSGVATMTLEHAYSDDPPVSQTWNNVAPGATTPDPPLAAGYNTGFIRYGQDYWKVKVVVTGGIDTGTWIVDGKQCTLHSEDDGAHLTFSVSRANFLLVEISGSCTAGWSQRP